MSIRPSKGKSKRPVAGTSQGAPQGAPVNGIETLKSKLKNVSPGGLLDMINQLKNTSPDQWKDAKAVKDMAKVFADKLKIPVSEERLNQFMKAYQDATKGGEPTADVDQLVQKYGQGKVDDKTLEEMKKFIKTKK